MSRPGRWDFNPDNDFLIVDGLEDLLVSRAKPDGTYENAHPTRGCREVPKRNTPIVLADAVGMTWHIHAPDWPFDALIPGDRIEGEDEIGWIILEADLSGASDQWICRCTKEVVSHNPQS